MVRRIAFGIVLAAWLAGETVGACEQEEREDGKSESTSPGNAETIRLPEPKYDGKVSVERALRERRTVRSFKDEPLALHEVSQLLWAAQGITEGTKGLRTAPSAGALYPLEVYLIVGNVEGLGQGAYKYEPHEHQLIRIKQGDVRGEFAAALGQNGVNEAGAAIVFFGVYERETVKFGEMGVRYVHMEVGHAAQNVHFQATALNLGTGVIGGFPESRIKKILNVPEEEQLLYIMPVGRMRPDGETEPQRNP
jgi:SagB-type dehydrogenase family enzyme